MKRLFINNTGWTRAFFMPKECYFCEIQKEGKFILENEAFFAIYDDFPVSKGHSLLVVKKHIKSFFELKEKELKSFYESIKKLKKILQKEFNPDAFNIGINEGKVAGRTIDHLHIHLIPRYKGDVKNPVGGVRNITPGKGDYTKFLKKE